MREPFISQARELVGEENAVLFAEPGLYLKTFNLVATGALIRGGSQTVDRVLRALVRAERFATAHPKECVRIVATRLGLAESDIESVWPEIDLRVTLDQALLRGLEDEAQWAIKNDLVEAEEPPNYLDFIYLDGLKRVRPESISIIH